MNRLSRHTVGWRHPCPATLSTGPRPIDIYALAAVHPLDVCCYRCSRPVCVSVATAAACWLSCSGEKPIVYDREWRMHMPNPNLLRVTAGSGPDDIPRSLVDLVYDCGAYQPEQRPSMREVSTVSFCPALLCSALVCSGLPSLSWSALVCPRLPQTALLCPALP
jgi:hypothetical protein